MSSKKPLGAKKSGILHKLAVALLVVPISPILLVLGRHGRATNPETGANERGSYGRKP